MSQIFDLFHQYGQWSVFIVVLLVQLGAPLPALPVLLLAGSFAAHNPLLGFCSLLLAVIASLLGDSVWYMAGRRYGASILKILCRITISPDSCVRQTEGSFGRRGLLTLLIAKFIPGLATLAPPLAGVLQVSGTSFILFSGLGAALWAGGWMLMGAVFHQQIQLILSQMLIWGKWAGVLLGGLLLLYVLYRLWQRYYLRLIGRIAKISVQDLVTLLQQPEQPMILDARSSLVRELSTGRIKGAQPIDVQHIKQDVRQLPTGRQIVIYCSCPNDVSALKVTAYLRRRGYQANALAGGIDAWISAGHQLDDTV